MMIQLVMDCLIASNIMILKHQSIKFSPCSATTFICYFSTWFAEPTELIPQFFFLTYTTSLVTRKQSFTAPPVSCLHWLSSGQVWVTSHLTPINWLMKRGSRAYNYALKRPRDNTNKNRMWSSKFRKLAILR